MNRSSLHLRLSAAAAISIIGALSLSGFFFMLLFERHVVRRVDKELSVYVKQIAATLEIAPGGGMELSSPLADPRFARPLSGLYWQVETDSGVALRSRSLWDQSLALPKFDAARLVPVRREIAGPDGDVLIARSRTVFFETPSGDRVLRLSAATSRSEIDVARTAFMRDLLVALGLLACALLGAAWLQVFFGLRPLKQIRQRIVDVRTGSSSRLEGSFPSEVQLLVGEVNALLGANDQAVARARDSAADLAHGLKTPLAVLQGEARALSERQQAESASEISEQVEQMRVRIERHLAVVRLRGPGGGSAGRVIVKSAFEKITNAMAYMPRGEDITWHLIVPSGLTVALDSQDFMEVFGNLLDNARKWAASEVTITVEESDGAVVIKVSDDGPGVPVDKIAEILQRGTRLDEQKTGAGLGLGIAKKIIEAYGGELSFENRNGGGGVSGVCGVCGVRVIVRVPKGTV